MLYKSCLILNITFINLQIFFKILKLVFGSYTKCFCLPEGEIWKEERKIGHIYLLIRIPQCWENWKEPIRAWDIGVEKSLSFHTIHTFFLNDWYPCRATFYRICTNYSSELLCNDSAWQWLSWRSISFFISTIGHGRFVYLFFVFLSILIYIF